MHNREFSESKNNAVFKPSKVNAKYYFDLVNHSYPLLFPFFTSYNLIFDNKVDNFRYMTFPCCCCNYIRFLLVFTCMGKYELQKTLTVQW